MIDIFYKSYAKDFKLLKYSLMSIKKNVTGYGKIILLVPSRDAHSLDVSDLPDGVIIIPIDEHPKQNGYLFQQVCKLKSFYYSNAEYIMFSDSDIIFDKPINLLDYVEGKPEILYTDYSKVESAIIWQKPTEDFMKEPVQYEFMRRNNLIYRTDTLRNLYLSEPNLEYIVMNSERFSEFNVMGAYAFKNERDKYNFINTDEWVYTEPKGVQLWGWAEKGNRDATHVYEYARTLEVINKVFDLNLTRY